MKTTAEKIAVMQAFEDGKAIECRSYDCGSDWHETDDPPVWNWSNLDYRVAVTKPSVDWSHLSRDIVAIATDSNGQSWLYSEIPRRGGISWMTTKSISKAAHLASFTPGTCDWKDSLVLRPEGDE